MWGVTETADGRAVFQILVPPVDWDTPNASATRGAGRFTRRGSVVSTDWRSASSGGGAGQVLTATVGEDDGATLTAAVREGRRPPSGGSGRGPWWSGWRCDGHCVVVIVLGLFGGDLGDGGAGGCLVDDGLVHRVGGDEGLQGEVVHRAG